MIRTPVDIISNKCFICEDRRSSPSSSTLSLPSLDVQFSDADTIVVKEFLEDVGLASVEVPIYMIPPYFAAEYDLRGYSSLDIFEDLRVQATYLPFMPTDYIHWLYYSIPLSRFFFVDTKWTSWGDAKGWDQEDQRQYEEWGAEEDDLLIHNESLDAQDDSSCDSQLSPSERSSRVSPGLFSIPSMENTKRRRTIYHARSPKIRDNTVMSDEFGRRKWESTSSLSTTT